jgi:hypothetical protein
MYQVFEGIINKPDHEKPCDHTGFPWAQEGGWIQSKYDKLADAIAYANKWLGSMWEKDNWKVGELYKYCGKSYVVIREIK